MNDNIILNISYPGTNPENIIFSAGFLYNSAVAGTLQLDYNQVKIKIWDNFTNLTISDTIGIEISA